MKPYTALQLARIDIGLTREALANELGVSTMSVYRWEHGKNSPAPYLRKRLCQILQIPERTLHCPEARKEKRHVKEWHSSLLVDPSLPAEQQSLLGQQPVLRELENAFMRFRTVGLTGLPGSGKTALAQTLTSLPAFRQQVEGIFWATIGQQSHPLRHLHRWLLLLGADVLPASVEEAQDRLRVLLRGRTVFVVLDDLWKAEDILPYHFSSCRYIVTTRLPGVAHRACDRVYQPRPLSEAQAFHLLKQRLPSALAREHRDVLQALLQQVGRLPLAITQIGNHLRSEAHFGSQRRIQEALALLFQPETYLHLQSVPDSCSVAASLQQSERWLPPSTQHALELIANALPTAPATFSEQQVADLLHTASGVHLQDLDHLVDAGLLSTIARNRYQLHPVIAAYVRTNSGEEVTARLSLHSWSHEASGPEGMENERKVCDA